jgi:ABC-type antimicrobial peptide transport system permease subunit
VSRTVVAEATTLALLALAFGLPIGVVVGRAVWRAFANWQGFPAIPTVAWLPLIAISFAVVVVAAVIALLPAWLAARTRPAVALRSE